MVGSPRLLVVALLSLASGCSARQQAHIETRVAEALVSPKEEMAAGQQIHASLAQKVKFLKDPTVDQYLSDVASRVFGGIRKPKAAEQIRVFVIDEPRVANAFAVPGGDIYVYSGLLLAARSEAQVAGVLAHEAGHVVARHAARQLLYLYGLSALGRIALGKDPSQLEQICAQILGQGFLLAHSRAEEREADRLAIGYLARSGYEPHGLPRFLERVLAREGDLPPVLVWLSSHPTSQSRVQELDRIIRERGLQPGERGVDRHEEVVEELRLRYARERPATR